jgi:hypothetical protein
MTTRRNWWRKNVRWASQISLENCVDTEAKHRLPYRFEDVEPFLVAPSSIPLRDTGTLLKGYYRNVIITPIVMFMTKWT